MNCKALEPIIAQLRAEYPDIEFREVNTTQNHDASDKYEITTVPTLVFERDGHEVARMLGLKPKSLIIKKIAEVFSN